MQPMIHKGEWYDIYTEDEEGGVFIMAAYLTGDPKDRIIWFDREWQFYDYELLAEVNDV